MELAIKAGGNLLSVARHIANKLPLPISTVHLPEYQVASEGLRACDWFRVYEIAEELWLLLRSKDKPAAMRYESYLNDYFFRHGIGWRMEGGKILIRDSVSADSSFSAALKGLAAAGMTTSARELEEARRDLSRRPQPDITGAIQHMGAAVECVFREVCGDPKSTFGDLVKRNPNLMPPTILGALEKIWGYASEMGRHMREGREPDIAEAFLAFELVSAATNYLLTKFPREPGSN